MDGWLTKTAQLVLSDLLMFPGSCSSCVRNILEFIGRTTTNTNSIRFHRDNTGTGLEKNGPGLVESCYCPSCSHQNAFIPGTFFQN